MSELIIVTEQEYTRLAREYLTGRGYLITPHVFSGEEQFNAWLGGRKFMKWVEPGAKGQWQLAVDHRAE
jgi:hypothetical protein